MQNNLKYFLFIFLFLLSSCSLKQGYVYSTKFFEPAANKTPINKKVCLLPLENNDPLIPIYLAEQEFDSYPTSLKTDAQKEGPNYNISLNQSLLKYIQSKNIFQQIELCEKQTQEYRLKFVLQKYNWNYYYPIHPIPAAIFLMGLPLFIARVENNISIKIDVFRNSEKISDYLHEEESKFNIFEKKIPVGAYKYVEIPHIGQGSISETYLDGIYDKLFEKIYNDAKSWK